MESMLSLGLPLPSSSSCSPSFYLKPALSLSLTPSLSLPLSPSVGSGKRRPLLIRFAPTPNHHHHQFGRSLPWLIRKSVIAPPVQASNRTYSNFAELLEGSELPLLVDFYATWCGPCQFMVPILEEVSQTLKDRVQIVKIDTEKYPSIASQYGVNALPTFVLFVNGKPADRVEGAMNAPELIERIESVLSTSKAKERE